MLPQVALAVLLLVQCIWASLSGALTALPSHMHASLHRISTYHMTSEPRGSAAMVSCISWLRLNTVDSSLPLNW